MFASFNNDNFPIVNVKLHEGPNNEAEYNSFINEWLRLYDDQKDFTFVFDTTTMINPSYKYALKMPMFIKRLKKREKQYLQKSIILINDNRIRWMLEFIFWIQPPVAPVYIYHVNNGIGENIQQNIEMIMNHPLTIVIEAGKPLLPIF